MYFPVHSGAERASVRTIENSAPAGSFLTTLAYYFAVAVLLLPIWLFRYFPSSDGPSHLFNSYVFLNYRHAPVFEKLFSLQVPTAGNLAGHGLAILMMSLGLPPEICEKLIVTLCALGMAAAFRFAVQGLKRAHPMASFLVLPFLYNWPLQMGFWSFSLGVPFLLLCVGLCLRYGGRWNRRSLGFLFASVAAVYVCHPIDWAVCGFLVAFMTVTGEWGALRRGPQRRQAVFQVLTPLATFLPFGIPNLIFARQNELIRWNPIISLRDLAWPLYTNTPVHLFEGDAHPARALFLIFLLISLGCVAWKIRRRSLKYSDVLLVACVALLIVGIFSPGRIGEGTYLGVRFLLFGYLLWALWLGVTVTSRAMPVSATIVVAITCWLAFARMPAWRAANHSLSELVRLGEIVPPNSFVCQMDLVDQTELVKPLEHAIDLLPARQIIDIRDYEAGRHAFWTRFRPGYFFDEDYLAPLTQKNFQGSLQRFESRTGRTLDFIVLVDLKASPKESLRQLLPSRWSDYELARKSEQSIAIYRLRHSGHQVANRAS